MKAYGITDCGATRKENQDTFRLFLGDGGKLCAAVLCDGMGGAQAGSVASAMAADAFMSHAANSIDERSRASDMREILSEAVNYANLKVYDRSYSDFTCMGMGSTLVAFVANSRRGMVANVGDSRTYIITRRGLKLLTRDHSLVEELVSRGEITREQARVHPQRNIITRAIGVEASVRCDIFEAEAAEGERILLCSDGLSNVLSEYEILKASQSCSEPEELCRRLIDAANALGANDNVTAVVIER